MGDQKPAPKRGRDKLAALAGYVLAAERAYLGSVILEAGEGQALDDGVDRGLEECHFYSPAHGALWALLVREVNQRRPIDSVSLAVVCGDDQRYGGPGYVAELCESVIATAGASHWVDIIIEGFRRREVLAAAERAADAIANGDVDVVRSRLSDDVELIDKPKHRGTWRRLDELVAAEAEAAASETAPPAGECIPTGIIGIDALCGGLWRGEFTIIGARPSIGKTALATQLAWTMAERGCGVAVHSLEMGGRSLAQRILAAEASITMTTIRRRSTLPQDRAALEGVAERMRARIAEPSRRFPIWVDTDRGLTTRDVRQRLRRLHRDTDSGIDVVFLDYVQLLRGVGRFSSRHEEVSAISADLKAIAGEMNAAFVGLSQLGRQVDERSNKRPGLADLKESGSLEQDADNVWLVHRPDHYDPEEHPGKVWILVPKQRQGRVGDIELRFRGEYQRFEPPVPT